MSYKVESIDVINTPKERVIDPRSKKSQSEPTAFKWWLAQNDKDLVAQVLSTTNYLKRTNAYRIKQASIFTRLLTGKPLYSPLQSNSTLDNSNQLPIGRPTANVVYSCTDTLVSRISQDEPRPVFLTDGGNYKERKMSEEANSFIQGEFFRTQAYDKGALMLRDGCALGDGLLKVFAKDNLVTLERTLSTELLVDFNDGYYGNPYQLIQLKLVDRSALMTDHPDSEEIIANSQGGYVDSSPRSSDTVSDQVIVAEAWHRRTGKDAKDGRHVLVCSDGLILDEDFDKDRFPFVKFGYNPNIVGWFSQGLAEILMPCQMEIYRQLIIASQSLELMGVPRILIEEMSKILETSFNNRIGTIVKYRNTPPEFVNPTSNNPEIYQFIQWLIQNAYQMSGISSLAATGQKPAGLNSGESLREYDGIQDDRFAALSKRYKKVYPELAHLYIDCATDIVKETGSYTTVYPGKDGTREVDFKRIKLLDNNYVIQVFEESSLPKDPAGRQAKLSEMLAAGEIDNKEFRRLSNLPDLKQSDRLAAALEERILYCLDEIVENGDKNYKDIAPDPFILDPSDLATTLSVNYINLYSTQNLEEEKVQLLRNWFTAVQGLKQQAAPPPVEAAPSPQTGQGSAMPPPAPPQAQISPTSNVAV